MGKVRFCVVSSEWYENNPLSVIEAQCLGTLVLDARIGGLPELVDRMFRSGDVNDFRVQLGKMWDDVFDYRRQTEEAQRRYDAEVYYKHLMEVYS